MKNIYQLAKLHRRAIRRSNAALEALTKEKSKNPPAKPWKGVSGVNMTFQRARLAICSRVRLEVDKELLRRRVGLPGLRNTTTARCIGLQAA